MGRHLPAPHLILGKYDIDGHERASSGGNRCFQNSTGPITERRPGGSTQISRGKQGRSAYKSKKCHWFPKDSVLLTFWGIFGFKFPLIPINSLFFQKVPIFPKHRNGMGRKGPVSLAVLFVAAKEKPRGPGG
jgi:hypothetical protein